MANTITTTTIVDGSYVLVVKIDILADTAAEYTDAIVVDASTFTPAFTDCNIVSAYAQLSGFQARLEFDATTDTPALSLVDGTTDFTRGMLQDFGPIGNTGGAGRTGDILLTTLGLGIGDHGTILLRLVKEI